MGKVILTRLARLLATLLAVTFLTFLLVALLPGDPVDTILGQVERTPEIEERIRSDLNLDDPFFARYFQWLGDAAQGDLGESYINSGTTVSSIIQDRIPITAQLSLMAITFALVLAIPIGITGAYKQGRWQDSTTSAGVQVALSIPNFVIGIFLVWIFSVKLGWLPATGWTRFSKDYWGNLKGALLPASALAMTQMAIFSRLIRADMIATLQENYILAARSKGLSDRFILARHALRPSSLSLMTIVGINFGALLGGTVVIEQLFGIGGLGGALYAAITKRDILVIQGITVFIATVYVVINTAVDLLYAVVDPRIRKG
jgi:peptide/nickel transport system permease protein